ncbi:tetratricopeptide repeat-containing glycosyltransferase family protein [Synechococcus sp. MU1642]|uniref:tetratricopeptide repeat-containing glycosyltransferase family protein n=1 Tax=Synechococcus sp. MU1642 TaxID=2508348 RepID=UPI001CF81A0D|nr:tetratricopeptide repeat-containing glycosyltransferase family protein [Synechococcus sp. MU1642]MCB4406945.1 hypothetical protein [Synechococcus sp. MU1642]
MSFSSDLERLEQSGQWSQALEMLRQKLSFGAAVDADHLHSMGRLYQRLGVLPRAERAYLASLRLDPDRPLTCNNLALLALHQLQAVRADEWLMQGLALARTSHEQDLLHATGCSLRLYQLRHMDALKFADRQLSLQETVMARTNRASCLHRLGRLQEAVSNQERAIRLHLNAFAPDRERSSLLSLIGLVCGDLQQTCMLQLMLMTQGIFRLCVHPGDVEGLKLLLAGQTADPTYWLEPVRQHSRWDGADTSELLVWDDQGFGDTLQNLAWLPNLASRVQRLHLWLRPSLIPLVRHRFFLPSNCELEPMGPQSKPWAMGIPQVGTYYLPIVMKAWTKSARDGGRPFMHRWTRKERKGAPRIGLVWSAGRHKAPQPERSARVRDVPRQDFFRLAQQWREHYMASLVSLQLEGHNEAPARSLIEQGVLEHPLQSTDWLQTAEVLESIDLLVSVDTSVAHLAGALGIPVVLMLSAPADWRWGQSARKTFLYDSMRIVRCGVSGDWSQALEQADLEVKGWFGSMPSNHHFAS